MVESLSTLRTDIRKATCTDEPVALKTLLAASAMSPERRETVRQNAIELVERCLSLPKTLYSLIL